MYIYVAGAYPKPNPQTCAENAIAIGHILMDCGHVPFVPNSYHFWDQINTRSEKEWLVQRLAILRKSEAMLLLPGDSPYRDREVALAMQMDIPIYFSLDEVPTEGRTRCRA